MSTKHKKIMFVVGVLALMLAGATGLYFLTHKEVEKEVRVPPSGEARHNSYLALERLLQQFNYDVDTVRRLAEPTSHTKTIILAEPSYDFSPEQVDGWATWVENGHHLILAQPSSSDDEKTAPLLPRLGFSSTSDETETLWPEDIDEQQLASDGAEEMNFSVSWNADDLDWLVRSSEEAVIAVSRPHGSGRATLVQDAAIFNNDRIGKGEHASLAVQAVALSTEIDSDTDSDIGASTVTIVRYGERQSWMFYVLGHTWPFVAVVLAALLLAIRSGRSRFGPQLADPPRERRSRREHIDAVGRFLWQQGSVATLIEATQKALLDELEHRRPTLGHVGPAERDEIAAEELGISYNEARDLFREPSGNRNAQSFTEQIRTLEQHRRRL
jgi:hypothetical protein